MSSSDTEHDQTDGRRARRERNRTAVIDVVIAMFREESLIPTIEEVSKRSGLSLRSVYRYFADPDELLEAVIARHLELSVGLAHLHAIGQGSLETRIEQFVSMRVRLFEHVGSTYRATTHNAPRNVRIRDELLESRQRLRKQFEIQFAAELDQLNGADRQSAAALGDLLTQLDSIDLLRRYRQLTVTETESALRSGLTALLSR